jgi:glycosyltransferase involved in cell wall biosynthesis
VNSGGSVPDHQGKNRRLQTVLFVGQLPPPVNGQTVMIQTLLDGEYKGIRLHHVGMDFSRSIAEVGAFRARKLLVLLKLLVKIVRGRCKSHAEVLYYPPAGPTLIPVMRDIVLLIGTRWMFQYTVFHFHAGGLSDIYPRLPKALKLLYNLAYRNADLAIFTTQSTSSIADSLAAKSVAIIPYGIHDTPGRQSPSRRETNGKTLCILFMGILNEGKGLLTLIDACYVLLKSGISFRVVCAGAFESEVFRNQVEERLQACGLGEIIRFSGVITGEEKSKAFRDADVFCFPSHYYAESFGVVLIEAMSFGLPIVSTRWRGIPDVVGGSGGAIIVEPKSPALLAQSLKLLLSDEELRVSMGSNNRAWFCDHYTVERYRAAFESELLKLRTSNEIDRKELASSF